jgi:multidrug efflux pump
MRRTLGTAVFAGMLGVTLFGIFLTPVFYSVIQWCNDLRARPVAAVTPAPEVRLPPGEETGIQANGRARHHG